LTIRYQANESKLDNLENKLIKLFGKIWGKGYDIKRNISNTKSINQKKFT
jgi:hypothetical protein